MCLVKSQYTGQQKYGMGHPSVYIGTVHFKLSCVENTRDILRITSITVSLLNLENQECSCEGKNFFPQCFLDLLIFKFVSPFTFIFFQNLLLFLYIYISCYCRFRPFFSVLHCSLYLLIPFTK